MTNHQFIHTHLWGDTTMKLNRMVGCLLVTLSVLVAHHTQSQTWERQFATAPTSNFASVQFLDGQNGYASGTSGTVFKTSNGGATWAVKPCGTSAHLKDHHFISASLGWAVGANGAIIKTTDGGTSWSSQVSGTTAQLNWVYFADNQVGYAAGASGTFLKTTNGGTTWTNLGTPTTANIENGWFTSATTAHVVCSDGTILRTTNAGAYWQTQYVNIPYNLRSVHFVSTTNGWAVGANGRIKRTVTGGDVWYVQNAGTTQQLNAVYFPHPDTGWVAGNGGLIMRTTNAGATWHTQASTTTEDLYSLFFENPRHGYAVGANNTVLEYAVVHAVPIQLASFTASYLGNARVRLNWTTISEINNYGFEVERSSGTPNNFELLPGSFIPGNGTTNERRDYTWTDNNAPAGRLYYRLKQIDLDGTINYTEPISVDVPTGVGDDQTPSTFALKQNYPNPFNPATTIEFSIPNAGFVSLRVFDVLGKEIATIVNEELAAGNFQRTFSAENLSSGVYYYKLTTGNFSSVKKLIVSK